LPTKTLRSISGQGTHPRALLVFILAYNRSKRTPRYVAQSVPASMDFSFLLPPERWRGTAPRALPHPLCVALPDYSASGIQIFLFAACLILRFCRRMIRVDKAGSKLCADKPRHAQVKRLSAACLRSTWQGGGDPLRCILPLCRTRPLETLPVSRPSGWRYAAAFRSWAVRP
jgi:hypothetical protein